MSRVAKNPVVLPKGVEVTLSGNAVVVKGSKGSLEMTVHESVQVSQEDGQLSFAPRTAETSADALAGTTRVLVGNMVTGVSTGFERKLQLIGVGYRAAAKGETVSLTLGLSHPVEYALPKGVTAETPTQTEIVLKSADKQLLGQVAAEIRSYRPPEPYKGKGIRYSDENVHRKEAKKK
jgi:large subunit ribosomal protein L6